MYTRRIKYTDYNGVEREENIYFNISKAEFLESNLKVDGGVENYLRQIIDAKDMPALAEVFKKLILMSYGEKSADGKHFVKVDENGAPLYRNFISTEAYSELYTEFVTDTESAIKFVIGILPKEAQEALASNKDKLPEVSEYI